MVYRVLGKLSWKGGLDKAEITILHRGAPDDRKGIPGGKVTSVKKGFFTYEGEEGRETVIPHHRILEVMLNGKPVWKRAGKE